MPCPCCISPLKVIGSRKRVWIQSSGERSYLQIRRMRCQLCRKIHHELPDVLVPFKHYDAECIEAVQHVPRPVETDVAADESSIRHWRCWFAAWCIYARGMLESLAIRYDLPVFRSSTESQSILHSLGRFVGTASGWLARAVRPIVNSHAWVTDPVCLSVR